MQIPTIIHELGHALGMIHPMSREDRDQFITLRMKNIKPDSDQNFRSITDRGYMYFTYGVPYDYKSIMHYNAVVLTLYVTDKTKKMFVERNSTFQNIPLFYYRCGQPMEMKQWLQYNPSISPSSEKLMTSVFVTTCTSTEPTSVVVSMLWNIDSRLFYISLV